MIKEVLRRGFKAGVQAMLNDPELHKANRDLDGVMSDGIQRAFDRWWMKTGRNMR